MDVPRTELENEGAVLLGSRSSRLVRFSATCAQLSTTIRETQITWCRSRSHRPHMSAQQYTATIKGSHQRDNVHCTGSLTILCLYQDMHSCSTRISTLSNSRAGGVSINAANIGLKLSMLTVGILCAAMRDKQLGCDRFRLTHDQSWSSALALLRSRKPEAVVDP